VGAAQSVIYDGDNAFQIAIDVIIPEPQHSETLFVKVTIALRVTSGVGVEVMLTAVDLDQHSVLETDKIYNVAVARSLAAEVKSAFFP
jgi:hypothetical protein